MPNASSKCSCGCKSMMYRHPHRFIFRVNQLQNFVKHWIRLIENCIFAMQAFMIESRLLQQVTQEAKRVLTRFNERQTTQRTTAHSRSYHCQRSSLEPMRTRAQNSKGRTFTKTSTNRLKTKKKHRPAGRKNQRAHNTTITDTAATLAIPQLYNMQEPRARHNYVIWDCSPLRGDCSEWLHTIIITILP